LPASQSEYYVKVELSDLDTPTSSTAFSTRADVLVPPPPQGGMYAFSVPLSQIYSLLVRPPRIGWWSGSLVVNARGGETHPALFFHDAECKVPQPPLRIFLTAVYANATKETYSFMGCRFDSRPIRIL
jgi:hypothetical protein